MYNFLLSRFDQFWRQDAVMEYVCVGLSSHLSHLSISTQDTYLLSLISRPAWLTPWLIAQWAADHGCGLHEDGKFWDYRTLGQFPSWTFVRLSLLVIKSKMLWLLNRCHGPCRLSIPGQDTCDRQCFGQKLNWKDQPLLP